MPERYIEWMLETATILDQKEGWKHYLWVVYEDLMPATMKQLSGTNIEPKSIYQNSKMKKLKDISSLNNKELFEEALQSSLFGRASDIFRLEVLWKMGGIYRDTDYRFSQSPRWLNMWYDSYVGIEPMSTFIGNALLAMKPQHPIIKTAISLVDRNLTDYTTPAYIEKITSDPQFTTVISTGPGMISFAFHVAAGEKGNADVAFPPALLYPSVIPQVYPQKDVLKPNDPVHPEALGVHFWETSWASKDFGSEG